MTKKTIQLPKMQRTMQASARALPIANGKTGYALSVSSEQPVKRYGGPAPVWYEVLEHTAEAVDMSRVDGMPLLLEHDMQAQIGAVNDLQLVERRLESTVRFSASQRALEIESDVADGIRRNVSVGYIVQEFTADAPAADGTPTYRATKWMPYEVSLVSVPADHTVGLGRADAGVMVSVVINTPGAVAAADDKDEVAEVPAADDCAPGAACDTPTLPGKLEGDVAAEVPAADTATEAVHPVEPAADETPAEAAAEPASAEVMEKEAETATNAEQAPADATNAETAGSYVADDTEEEKKAKAAAAAGRSLSAKDSATTALITPAAGLATRAALEILELSRSKPLNFTANLNKMTDKTKDMATYSYARAIQVALNDATGGVEAEQHQEFMRNLPTGYAAKGGIMVPMHTGTVRTLTTQTKAAGGALVYEQAGELIDLLRDRAVIFGLGARLLSGLTGPVSFPKITGGAQAHWVSENAGTDVTGSAVTFGSVGMTPKTLQATTAVSRQLIAQANTNIESIIRSDLATAHALAIDKAAFHGAGGVEPLGIFNTPGVNAINFGGVPSYGKLVDAVAAVLASNALLGTTGFACTPQLAARMAQTLIAQASGAGFLWNGRLDAGTVAGFAAVASNQLSKTLGVDGNDHGLVFGNFADVLVGTFGAMELVVDPFALKKQGLIEITSFQLADVAIRHGESFTVATGAKAA